MKRRNMPNAILVSAVLTCTIFVSNNLEGAVQIQEGFSSTSTPDSWTANAMYYNTTANHGDLSGSYGAGFNAIDDWLYTPALNTAGTLTFWIKGSSSPSDIGMKIQKSVDASNWTDLEVYTKSRFTTTWENITIYINDSSSTLYVRFFIHDRSGNSLYLDDIEITDYSFTGVEDPTDLNVTPFSSAQIDLSWTKNGNSDNVMIAYNTSDTFGTPSDGTSYAVSDPISGGGTIIYNGSGTSYNHTSLSANTTYYYKAWSVDGSDNYSSGVTANGTTYKIEPTNHVTSFSASPDGTTGYSQVNLTWTENDGSQPPDGYLIKASTADNISAPVDGSAVSDNATIGSNSGAKNITHGNTSYNWSGLDAETTYYFKIYPYTNSEDGIDYKTDGTVPSANATTDAAPEIPKLIISEVTDPGDVYEARFVEIYNNSGSQVDFGSDTWYLSRQTNGGSWEDKQLTGTLDAGDVYVAANNNGDTSDHFYTQFGFMADYDYGGSSGNGDDGYFLYYGGDHTTGTLVDAYGVIDVDGTGEAWEYEDKRAVRSGVTQGNTTWTASEWTITLANVADCTPGQLDNDQSLPVTLSRWDASSKNGVVQLSWTTDSEIENLGFIIDRALTEKGPWRQIADFNSHNALKGQGSTNTVTEYSFTDEAVVVGETYYYRLSDVDYKGTRTEHDVVSVTVSDKDQNALPGGFQLEKIFPNPFNPSVTIDFTVVEPTAITVNVFDLQGRLVNDLIERHYAAGNYQIRWNGLTHNGRPAPSGIYLLQIRDEASILVRKVILAR